MFIFDDSRRSRRTVVASAAYDLLVTAAFATPWTASLAFAGLAGLHVRLGLAGPPPQLDGAIAMLLANLLGSLVVVWALVRLRWPSARLGAADTLARLLFATWMVAGLAAGVSRVVLSFLVLELAWAVVQGVAVLRRADRAVDGATVGT